MSSVDEFGIENWERVIEINLTSCFILMSAAIPHMKKQDFGRIINISSVHGLVASPFKSAYGADHSLGACVVQRGDGVKRSLRDLLRSSPELAHSPCDGFADRIAVAAKHGLNGLTKSAALELAESGRNVTCNAICPGWVLTPLVQRQIDAIAEEHNITYKFMPVASVQLTNSLCCAATRTRRLVC